MKMTWVTLISALVQGVTEFFPISSSGHLSILKHIFNIKSNNDFFLVTALHVGALGAIIATYKRVIVLTFSVAAGLVFRTRKTNPHREKSQFSYYERLLILLTISSSPLIFTAILQNYYKQVIMLNNMLILGVGFLATSMVMWFANRKKSGHKCAVDMKFRDAFLIGLAQALIAPLPGISRSGITIAIGLLLGLSSKFCIMYSFLAEIPVIIGAAACSFKSNFATIDLENIFWTTVGIIISAILGYFCLNKLEQIVIKKKFYLFAYYTMVISVFVLGFGIYEYFAF
ncbi:MAG: undecaprenyl-diphosphate phosphatase [Oscillospiraceae bacterium]|jgi:undecaprenyl-diphosphatase|nr:undecaprenyl-diphosphate phosphatase [Oscillospiraceae bacterium]